MAPELLSILSHFIQFKQGCDLWPLVRSFGFEHLPKGGDRVQPDTCPPPNWTLNCLIWHERPPALSNNGHVMQDKCDISNKSSECRTARWPGHEPQASKPWGSFGKHRWCLHVRLQTGWCVALMSRLRFQIPSCNYYAACKHSVPHIHMWFIKGY